MATEKTRKKIVESFMTLAAAKSWDEMTLPVVAEAAGVDLATLRDAYDGRIKIVEDFARRIDTAVLKQGSDDMAGEPARDRLFDVLMTRLDHLAPYRDALRNLMCAAKRDPMLAAAFNRIAVVSQGWMLAAAGIDSSGTSGLIKAQGLAVGFARVVAVWLDEEDPDLPKTMAALDRELNRGQRALRAVDKIACLVPDRFRPAGFGKRCKKSEAKEPDAPAETAA
ncbi:MAG: TetR family transcriptional regulator [Hyphomicrobiales bacterium]|nr:MAG: TetR family transcriptional regulator [Hyphomicrobiales bacterium]